MSKYCASYETRLDEYLCGLLDDEQCRKLQKHLVECKNCREYVLQQETRDRELSEWAGSMEPQIQAGLQDTLAQLAHADSSGPLEKGSMKWIRYAVAAMILLAAGFLAGKQFGSQTDLKAIESRIVSQLRRDMEQGLTQLHGQLSQQVMAKLDEYAAQTLTASTYQTQELLTDLIQAINTAQVKDRQWTITALNQIEENRLADKQQLGNNLIRLASLTEGEIQRTRQEMASLLWMNQDDVEQ